MRIDLIAGAQIEHREGSLEASDVPFRHEAGAGRSGLRAEQRVAVIATLSMQAAADRPAPQASGQFGTGPELEQVPRSLGPSISTQDIVIVGKGIARSDQPSRHQHTIDLDIDALAAVDSGRYAAAHGEALDFGGCRVGIR